MHLPRIQPGNSKYCCLAMQSCFSHQKQIKWNCHVCFPEGRAAFPSVWGYCLARSKKCHVENPSFSNSIPCFDGGILVIVGYSKSGGKPMTVKIQHVILFLCFSMFFSLPSGKRVHNYTVNVTIFLHSVKLDDFYGKSLPLTNWPVDQRGTCSKSQILMQNVTWGEPHRGTTAMTSETQLQLMNSYSLVR